MKFYFEGEFTPAIEAGKLAKVSIYPATQNKAHREIFVLVANELKDVASGQELSIAFVGTKKNPMAFPFRCRSLFPCHASGGRACCE